MADKAKTIVLRPTTAIPEEPTGARKGALLKNPHSGPFSKSGGSPPSPSIDLVFENHFSLFLIRPVSQAGQDWLHENVGDAETLTFGEAIVCEPRYVESILLGANADGLVCR